MRVHLVLRHEPTMQRGSLFSGAIVLAAVVGLALVFVPGTSEASRTARTAGLCLAGIAIPLTGLVIGRRAWSNPPVAAAEAALAADHRPGGWLARSFDATSIVGLTLLLIGVILSPAAILGLLGIPLGLAGTIACATAALRASATVSPARRTVGTLLIVVGWLIVGAAAFATSHLIQEGPAGSLPVLVPFWLAGPLLLALGHGLRENVQCPARALPPILLFLATGLLAFLCRDVLPRSL